MICLKSYSNDRACSPRYPEYPESKVLGNTSRKNKDGSVVEYYQLAPNESHPKSVTHIIHSFGRADELDRDQLVRLCQSIARVCDVQVIDPLADAESRTLDSPVLF